MERSLRRFLIVLMLREKCRRAFLCLSFFDLERVIWRRFCLEVKLMLWRKRVRVCLTRRDFRSLFRVCCLVWIDLCC